MLASRAMKPKLSINIAPVQTQKTRPSLSLRSPITPLAPLRSPMGTPVALSPLPMSPTARNTKMNQKGFSTLAQQPTYSYTNNSTSRSILKRTSTSESVSGRVRQLSFEDQPVVYSISPIEEPEYYGGYRKMTRDDRRWMVKN